MNSTQLQQQDRFARQITARLAAGTAELPYEITERLRAARVQALSQRKRVAMLHTASAVSSSGSAAALTLGDEPQSWWSRVASLLPIIALAAGLIMINSLENDRRASEVAEVD